MAARQSGNAPSANENAYVIDSITFSRRLQALYSHWHEHRTELWNSSNVLAIATQPISEDLRYLKSSALNIWLLGYEFPETIMVFTNKQIHFLCSQKKASLLQVVKKSAKEALGLDVVIHIKVKSDDGTTQMDTILSLIRSQSKSVLGYIAKEAPEGKLLEAWTSRLKKSSLQLVDITNGLSDLFAVKDDGELTNVKNAAYLTASAMKFFVVPMLEKVIDEEKKVTHSSLMDNTEKAILEPARVKVKLKADNVDICYPPIFQSGGEFDLRPSASSSDEYLYYDHASVIICAIGSKHGCYCSNIARTYLIDSNEMQIKAYNVLLKAFEAAIAALKPDNKAGAVYRAALTIVEREAPELVLNLTKSAGTGIGLEFRESGLSLNLRNDRVLKTGMAFNVTLGFQNLQNKASNPKCQNFSLLLADTVIVTEFGQEVLTSLSSRAVNDVAYSFNVEEEAKAGPVSDNVSLHHSLRSNNQEMSKEELRRLHQAELARMKNEETARRLAGEVTGTGQNRKSTKISSDLIAYKTVNDLPHSRETMIQVDQRNEAILVPVYGAMVPFHIAMVKTVTSQQENNRNCLIHIIFNVPTPHDANSLKNQAAIFIKELTFRSKDARHISEVVQLIKTLRKNVVARESERAERATLVTQEKLVLAGNKFKPMRLTDLWIRPPFGGRGRKLTGTLEAHVNGFRYSTSRTDERVDIMYSNVKHAFFQAAEREMITLLHFHLHNHIMVGNKKTKDVQFYVEVMDAVQTLAGAKRSAYDPDEVEEEQRERDRRNKVNKDFDNFVSRVHDLWGQPNYKELGLEFDQPLREFGFFGVPYKSSAFVVPSVSCLVELIETPFLVVTLSEIEIVNFERVGLGQKNFDMAIVFKDFKKDVLRIDSIPCSSLEVVKEWLNAANIKYYESRLNLNWREILKTIIDDPEQFIEKGWDFLDLEGSDSDSDESEDSDQRYEPSDGEVDSESDDDDSGSESLVESDEDDEDEDSEEEKGKTWDELEKEASNADREEGNEYDSEDEKKRRKAKALGKARGGGTGQSSSGYKRPKLR